MDNNRIGKYIVKRRKELHLTQLELGNKLFVTDKAVSKWERGLSLPDITLLDKLAKELDTDIYSILQIENRQNIDIEKILQIEKHKIKKQLRKRITIIISPIIIITCIILFKLIPFGYDVMHIRYNHNTDKLINLGVPKFSFYMQNNEDNYAYKSLRGKSILKSEVKAYLNTLEPISCNNTTYFYDNTADITIIDYSITSNILYNNINYSIRNGNYCDTLQIKEYNNKLGLLGTLRTLYNEDTNLIIYFLPNLKTEEHNEWTASLEIYYQGRILEHSIGTFEIINDELIYYRTQIKERDQNIDIPNISNFIIRKQKLILKDNYLKEYEKEIILK